MEVDWAYQQNATDINSKSSHALDPSRTQEEGTTKRDVEEIRGVRNKGWWSWGRDRKETLAGSRQTTMSFLGVGVMWSTLEED